MINKIEGAAATVVQSGTIGSNTENSNGFAEELAKQVDNQDQKNCCGKAQDSQKEVGVGTPLTSSQNTTEVNEM